MFLKQLTVFLENREGRLESVTDLLAKNKINIACLALGRYQRVRCTSSDRIRSGQSKSGTERSRIFFADLRKFWEFVWHRFPEA